MPNFYAPHKVRTTDDDTDGHIADRDRQSCPEFAERNPLFRWDTGGQANAAGDAGNPAVAQPDQGRSGGRAYQDKKRHGLYGPRL